MRTQAFEGERVTLVPQTVVVNQIFEAPLTFAVRARGDGAPMGCLLLEPVDRARGLGRLTLDMPALDEAAREAVQLALGCAFAELDLRRVLVVTCEYERRAIYFLSRAGFLPEARRRNAIQRNGRDWDAITFGIQRREWQASQLVRPALAACAGVGGPGLQCAPLAG